MSKFSKILQTVILILLMCISLTPFYVMIVGSFKENSALLRIPPDILPFSFIADNYQKMIEINFFRPFLNSVIISSGTVIATLFVATCAGYAFAKKNFFGKNILFVVLIATMIIPRQIIMVPTFILLAKLGLFDNYLGLILPAATMPFGVFLIKQFMQTIPDEIIDAAKVDGASEIRTFIGIVVPLSKMPIAALTIFSFVASWNDYFWQLILISSRDKFPLPVALAHLMTERNMFVGYQLAGAVIATVPILAIFIVLQKYFLGGITIGAVKG